MQSFQTFDRFCQITFHHSVAKGPFFPILSLDLCFVLFFGCLCFDDQELWVKEAVVLGLNLVFSVCTWEGPGNLRW